MLFSPTLSKVINMKKYLLTFLLAVVLIFLSACGSEPPAPVPTTEPTPLPPSPNAVSTLPGSDLQSTPEPEAVEPTPAVEEAVINAILALQGEDVSALYDLIGEPLDSSYIPSCLGPGDDGELYYEGFTVATYREGEKEIVWDVIVNAG